MTFYKSQIIAFSLGPPEIILILLVLGVFGIIAALIILIVIKVAKKTDTEDQQSSLPTTIETKQELGICRVCNGKVSINATSCPHCGDTTPIKLK
ncbi:MAG: hypothetical protein OSB55_14955 [Verrucomicrobiota bacterium]|nr:hypothetical protein [Verrucomicrobiota bacterium]